MSIYENNLQALLHSNPVLAAELFAITENKQFEVFQGKDPIDINMYDLENNCAMYEYPVDDVTSMVDNKHQYSRYPYRYFYGIGNGIYLKTALKAIALKRILLIEPSSEMLYIVLNMIDFSEELTSKKLILETTKNLNFSKAHNYLDEGKLFARLFELEIISPYYLNIEAENYSLATSVLTQALAHLITGHGNSAIDALIGIEHHFINLPEMIKGPVFKNILGKAEGETAIIVSTGPSLTKQLPLLKKIQKHVSIISLDASLPILEKNGIKPDYVTVIERVPLTAKFFERTSPQFQKDINYICVSIIHQDVKDAIKEGNLYLQMRPHGYTRYFGLDKFGYLGVGMSTANLAHELAIVLGFKNAILIGQDLAFGDDDSSHADNHTFDTTEIDPTHHDLFTTRYGGEGQIRTTNVWNLFRNHYEGVIEQTKSFFNTINSTEGGARITGSIEMPFQKAVEKYVDLSFHKKLVSPTYLKEDELREHTDIIINKTNLILKEAVKVQTEIEELFIKVQEASEELVELSQTGQLESIDFDKLQNLSDEIDVVKGYSKDPLFNEMFFDTIQSYLVQQELELAEIFVQQVQTEEERQTKLVDWVMKHRYWLFSIAGGIDAQRTTILRAIEKWPQDLKEQITIPEKKEIAYDQAKYERLKEQAEQEQEERERVEREKSKEVFKQIHPEK